jgi:hypothetical protein
MDLHRGRPPRPTLRGEDLIFAEPAEIRSWELDMYMPRGFWASNLARLTGWARPGSVRGLTKHLDGHAQFGR